MPRLSQHSRDELMTCHPALIKIVLELIKYYDVRVVHGHRNEEQQNLAFQLGNTTKRWPDSLHNEDPSLAVDLAPWPEMWGASSEEFSFMAGRFMQIADNKEIEIRWGGDWDSDDDMSDQSFMDLGHFEVIG